MEYKNKIIIGRIAAREIQHLLYRLNLSSNAIRIDLKRIHS